MFPYRVCRHLPAWLCRWFCPTKTHDLKAQRVASLRQLREPLAVITTAHLSDSTFAQLKVNQLSVQAYVHDYGAFIYLGAPLLIRPEEPDLREIAEAAIQAEVTWLGFDVEGAVVEGLPLFRDPEEESLG